MRKPLIALTLSFIAAFSAEAKDAGVQGNIWPIIEIDFRQLMLESAARANWDAVRAEVKGSTDRYFETLPRRVLPSVERTETTYIDPSIQITSDIRAPIPDADGNLQWRVLVAKGTSVNPLEKVRPLTAMLFFDGNSETQLKFVKEALAMNPRLVPVETAGANVRDISKAYKRPVFYANELMMTRFRVGHLPALLYPGDGKFVNYLALTSFGEPYSLEQLETVWPVVAKKTGPVVITPTVTPAEQAAVLELLNLSPKPASNAKQK